MSSRSVRKPRPTRDTEHFLQLKQSLCHWRSSKEMYLLPPSPTRKSQIPGQVTKKLYINRGEIPGQYLLESLPLMGVVQEAHFLAYRLQKQLRQ
jgi:hypothetical protein